jgi:hypothetical protein
MDTKDDQEGGIQLKRVSVYVDLPNRCAVVEQYRTSLIARGSNKVCSESAVGSGCHE